jgi:hypothetical protein
MNSGHTPGESGHESRYSAQSSRKDTRHEEDKIDT